MLPGERDPASYTRAISAAMKPERRASNVVTDCLSYKSTRFATELVK